MEVTLLFKYSQDEYVKGQRQYLLASKIITKTSMVVIPICLLFAQIGTASYRERVNAILYTEVLDCP